MYYLEPTKPLILHSIMLSIFQSLLLRCTNLMEYVPQLGYTGNAIGTTLNIEIDGLNDFSESICGKLG